MSDTNLSGDLLMGAGSIAKYLGLSPRQVYRLIYAEAIPTFKLGGSVAARKTTLLKWLDANGSME